MLVFVFFSQGISTFSIRTSFYFKKAFNGFAAAKCETDSNNPWNCSTPCTICRELRQTKQPALTPQLQLAILAARLTTKIADNDALFRCNAELAQTNLRLQSEVSELRKQMARYVTSTSNTGISSVDQQSLLQPQHIPKQSSNQFLEQKVMHKKEKEFAWNVEDFDAKLVSTKFENAHQQSSLDQQTAEFIIKDEIKMLGVRELESQQQDKRGLRKKLSVSGKFEEQNEKMENNAEGFRKCLGSQGEYCLKHKIKMEQLKNGFEIKEDVKNQQKLEKTFEDKKLEVNRVSSKELLLLKSENTHLTDSIRNSNEESEKLREELQSTNTPCGDEGIHRKLLQANFTDILKKEKEEVKTKLTDESNWILDDVPEQFQTSLEEQAKDIFGDSMVAEGKMQSLQELEGHLQQREIVMHEVEKKNKSLGEQLKSQEQLNEGMQKKLDATEECSMTLEEINVNMEQEITDQKKKYELIMEKSKLRDQVENTVIMKLREEIISLKQENESLIVELTRKQSSLDKEKERMKAELINLKCQLANREIVLEELTTKLKHMQEKSIHMQRQLDDSGMQMCDLQKKEVNQEFHQQFVEAERKITELEHKLDQMVKQNGLLKSGEQKLMDALAISNKQLAKTESKNEKLESEISNLQNSLLKAREVTKKMNYLEKSVVRDETNPAVEAHGKAEER